MSVAQREVQPARFDKRHTSPANDTAAEAPKFNQGQTAERHEDQPKKSESVITSSTALLRKALEKVRTPDVAKNAIDRIHIFESERLTRIQEAAEQKQEAKIQGLQELVNTFKQEKAKTLKQIEDLQEKFNQSSIPLSAEDKARMHSDTDDMQAKQETIQESIRFENEKLQSLREEKHALEQKTREAKQRIDDRIAKKQEPYQERLAHLEENERRLQEQKEKLEAEREKLNNISDALDKAYYEGMSKELLAVMRIKARELTERQKQIHSLLEQIDIFFGEITQERAKRLESITKLQQKRDELFPERSSESTQVSQEDMPIGEVEEVTIDEEIEMSGDAPESDNYTGVADAESSEVSRSFKSESLESSNALDERHLNHVTQRWNEHKAVQKHNFVLDEESLHLLSQTEVTQERLAQFIVGMIKDRYPRLSKEQINRNKAMIDTFITHQIKNYDQQT